MKLSSPKNTTTLGMKGEQMAAEYLKKNGYRILDTNFKNPFGRRLGEIDIIAKDKDCLIFIEVKTRLAAKNMYIIPEESINKAKLLKLNKIISFYIRKYALWGSAFRIDAISILIDKENGQYNLKHLKNIFI